MTARRGDPQKGDSTEIGSPMVVEAPFFMADPAARKDTWMSSKDFVDLRAFRCQGILINRLMTKVQDADGGKLKVAFQVLLHNPNNNHDKSVRVEVALRNGDQKIAGASFGPVKVEESDSVNREVSMVVSPESLKTDAMTSVQLTVTAADK